MLTNITFVVSFGSFAYSSNYNTNRGFYIAFIAIIKTFPDVNKDETFHDEEHFEVF